MEKLMNKLEDMELDMVAGGKIFPRPRPGCHDSNANYMAANVDETQTAWWKKVAKIKPD